ncbi:MAG: GAF domain-containing protein [Chryseobacterium sp.]|nr:MAG: GAF domain-containing protein [Chryseobacterium sp.]
MQQHSYFGKSRRAAVGIAGHIQSYGCFAAVDVVSRRVRLVSRNIKSVLGIDAEKLLGRRFEDFQKALSAVLGAQFFPLAGSLLMADNEGFMERIFIRGVPYYLQLRKDAQLIYYELEPLVLEPLTDTLQRAGKRTVEFPDTDGVWNNLVTELHELLGFDRILVYKFSECKSGRMIAEAKAADLDSYLDLHLVGDGTSAAARDVYSMNNITFIPDIGAELSEVLSTDHQLFDDLNCSYRKVSDHELQVLSYTKSQANLNVGVFVDGKFWGLVVCLHRTPRMVDLRTRYNAEVLTRMAANAYAAQKSREQALLQENLHRIMMRLKDRLLLEETLEEALAQNLKPICRLLRADSMATVFGEEIESYGEAPDASIIGKIADWAIEQNFEGLYEHNTFLTEMGGELELDSTAAGVLICILSQKEKQLLIWFRKEIHHVVKDPITPERPWAEVASSHTDSAEKFRQRIKEHCGLMAGKTRPWHPQDLDAAKQITDAVLETSYARNAQIMQLNRQLAEVNKQLDSFSYTVSHDLNTPLTVILLNAQRLALRCTDAPEMATSVDGILQQVDIMRRMIKDVLALSRARKADLQLSVIEPAVLISNVLSAVVEANAAQRTKITVGATPNLVAEPTMLYQVFLNIIGNAVKYSSKALSPEVKIEGAEEGECVVYRVTDNGIGIEEKDRSRMFRIFNRMDNAREFAGTGVGLAIVHNIMERLGGKIDYQSAPGKGTCFELSFKKE